MREKCKIKHKFGGAKAYKVEQVRKYFVNPKIGNEVFGQCVNYIICSLDFRNTEAVVHRCTSEQLLLKILQCLQKNTWAEVLKACNFIKKRLVAASGNIS